MKKLLILLCMIPFFAMAQEAKHLELTYIAWYAPNNSDFQSVNVQPQLQVAYKFDSGKIVGGVLTNHDASQSSVYGGTAYNFFVKGNAAWYGQATAGVDIDKSHQFFTTLGAGLSYSIGKNLMLEGGFKKQWYGQQEINSFGLGISAKL